MWQLTVQKNSDIYDNDKDIHRQLLFPSLTQIVDMLLGYALRLEYGDNVEKFKKITPEEAKTAAVAKPILNTGNPLDNLDPTAEEFRFFRSWGSFCS